MLYLCVLLLGLSSSFVLSAVGLILLSSVLFVGLGVAGALHHEPLFAVLLEACTLSITLQVAYATPLMCVSVWSLWSDRSRSEPRNPAAMRDEALTDDPGVIDVATQPSSPTTASIHIRGMITRIYDRRRPLVIDNTPGKPRRVA